jgi:hypothetical protein
MGSRLAVTPEQLVGAGGRGFLSLYLSPLNWRFGDDARDLLVLVGLMLSATGFFVEFLASRLNRLLREVAFRIGRAGSQYHKG